VKENEILAERDKAMGENTSDNTEEPHAELSTERLDNLVEAIENIQQEIEADAISPAQIYAKLGEIKNTLETLGE
jgi:hypothetical protein